MTRMICQHVKKIVFFLNFCLFIFVLNRYINFFVFEVINNILAILLLYIYKNITLVFLSALNLFFKNK